MITQRLNSASKAGMNDPLSNEMPVRRFDLYIKELRELFISHGMRVGTMEDVLALSSNLTSPGPAYDDITSIVRSIIFREHEAIPRPELLRLITIAVAGSPPIGEQSAPIQLALLQLESYVGEVISSLRRRTFVEDPEEPEASSDEALVNESVVATPLEAEHLQEEVEAGMAASPVKESETQTVAPPLVSAAMDAPKAVPLFADPSLDVTSAPIQPPAHQLQTRPASTLIPLAVDKKSPPRRYAWIFGIAAMFLILLAGLVWRQKSTVQSATLPNSSPMATPSSPPPSQQPTALLADTVPSPQASDTTPPKPKPSAAHLGASSSGSATQPTTSATPSHPSQLAPQPNAPSGPQVPPRAASAAPQRSGPTVGGQRLTPASAFSAAGRAGSFLVSSGVMDGHLITIPTTPSYPKMANMTGIEGKVILQAVISSNGTVVATHVLDGHHLLRGAAAHAVRGWHYRPYLVHGKPTDVATIVIVDFHLPH